MQSIAYVSILKWDRNQPRVPKGSPESGRWTQGGVSQGLAATTMAGRTPRTSTFKPPEYGFGSTEDRRMEADRAKAAGFATIMNAPMGTGFANPPRITGQSSMVRRLTTPSKAPVVSAAPTGSSLNSMRTGNIADSEEINPGTHANETYKVTLEDGTVAALKAESGERWAAAFWNDDISNYVINRDLSLGEREAIAFEVSEALGLDLVPETVLREHIDVVSTGQPFEGVNIMNDEAPHPHGGSLTKWVPGIDSDGQKATPQEIRRLAVLDYAMGQMDRHPNNVSFDANGKLLAMDNGYSLPAPIYGHDEFTFRSATTRTWRESASDDFPEDERKQMADALDRTDWTAFADRHSGMSSREREAFLGRIENLKEAMKTTTGLKELWKNQTLYVDN